jgi:starvation-inducible DNA-binding protein
MNEHIIAAKICLANTFVFYYKAQAYHWNVEGMFFPQFHDFFGDLYAELYGAVDPFAEEIRALREMAPKSLDELTKYKTIDGSNSATDAEGMVADLLEANDKTIESLNKLFDLLSEAKEQGFADFVAGRIDAHKKHGWMLRAILKKN